MCRLHGARVLGHLLVSSPPLFYLFFISNCFSKLQLLGSHAQARQKGFASTPVPSPRSMERHFIASALAQRGTDKLGKLEKQHPHCSASPPQPLQGPWRRCSSPPPSAPDLGFWPIASVAQLVTTSSLWLQFMGGKVGIFLLPVPCLQGMQPLCACTRRVPKTCESQAPGRANEQLSLGAPMAFSKAS